mgnify:CR=1 FL=1
MMIVSFGTISFACMQLLHLHGFFIVLTLLLGVFIFFTVSDKPLEVQGLKSIVKSCDELSTIHDEAQRRNKDCHDEVLRRFKDCVASMDIEQVRQFVETSELQMEELSSLKVEIKRVTVERDARLSAQSASNGADEVNAVNNNNNNNNIGSD